MQLFNQRENNCDANSFLKLLKNRGVYHFDQQETSLAIISYSIITKFSRNSELVNFPMNDMINFICHATSSNHNYNPTTSNNSLSASSTPSVNIPVANTGRYQLTITQVNSKTQEKSINNSSTVELLSAVENLIVEYENNSARINLNDEILVLDEEVIYEDGTEFQSALNDYKEVRRRQYTNIIGYLSGENEITWGRIVSILGFTCDLALLDFKRGNRNAPLWYLQWANSFINGVRISSWIQEQPDGWSSLLTFQRSKSLDFVGICRSTLWTTMVASVATYSAYQIFKFFSK